MRHASIPGALFCGTRRLCKNAAALLVAGILTTGLILVAGPAQAVSVPFVPSDLNPGDTYHVAFLTQDGSGATSTDIGTYNAFVQGQAELSGAVTESWAVSWFAIGSTATVDARDNIPVTTAPIYLLSDVRVADNEADMWPIIQTAISVNQFGSDEPRQLVWTGSLPGGTANITVNGNNSLGGGNPQTGDSGPIQTVGNDWISALPCSLQDECDSDSTPLSFYAVSEELTVVPVPASVWLIGFGLLGLVGVARRSKA